MQALRSADHDERMRGLLEAAAMKPHLGRLRALLDDEDEHVRDATWLAMDPIQPGSAPADD